MFWTLYWKSHTDKPQPADNTNKIMYFSPLQILLLLAVAPRTSKVQCDIFAVALQTLWKQMAQGNIVEYKFTSLHTKLQLQSLTLLQSIIAGEYTQHLHTKFQPKNGYMVGKRGSQCTHTGQGGRQEIKKLYSVHFSVFGFIFGYICVR